MEPNHDRSLIPLPAHEIAGPQIGGNRILGQMVDEVLTLGRGEAEARIPPFRIGDYTWWEPDYRQILLWANQLKMEPVDLLDTLVADKPSSYERSAVLTKFENGRIFSLRWDLDKLPISDMRCVEGLKIQEIKLHSAGESLSFNAMILGEPPPPKRPSRKIRLSLPTLRRLNHAGCESETIFLENVQNLTELICHVNELEYLNLSLTPNLTKLYCDRNKLEDLNLSHVPNLTELSCRRNHLADLKLSHVPNLIKLRCSRNQIRELNLSAAPNLTELSCAKNHIEELDISRVPYLIGLSCSENRIGELDLSRVPNLTGLGCSGNQIEELTLSRVPDLTALLCGENHITKLDLSDVPNLTTLLCKKNDIAELDIRPLRNLVQLEYDSDKTRLIQRPDQNF